MELFQVQPHEIDLAWREGASSLGDACKWASREITPDQLKFLLARGERTLIGARIGGRVVGWAAIQVQQLPNLRVLYVFAIRGAGIVNADGLALLRQYARANGCTSIRGAVRASMQRLLKRLDAKPLYMTCEVEA